MKIRSFLFLCVAAGMCFMSCRNGHTSGADAAPEATMPSDSMSVCKDRTVIVSETDSRMRYSAYKEFASGEWTEIHPRNRVTKYCSNYLVFYR